MCISPSYVWVQLGPKWQKQNVPCKQCWRCKKNRIEDYIGRSMAEASTSQAVCTLTLTYAPRDDLADKIINPRHFQLFMKLLRRAGHKVRYLVAAEYGDTKGRAHFHAILFFQELVPLSEQYPLYERGIVPLYKDDYPEGKTQDDAPFCREVAHQRMVHIRQWPHGHIFCDWNADERAIRYVCKYILADDKNKAWFSLSKKPALGADYFAHKAFEARTHGVLPSSFRYRPPGAEKDKYYPITGASRRDYLNAITTDPADKPRMSEWTLKTFEKHERQRLNEDLNGQPVEVLEQAWIERREAEEEQQHLMRLSASLREAGDLDEMLTQSESGLLRRINGRWSPSTRKES